MANNKYSYCKIGDIAAPIKNALVGGPFGSNLVSRDYVPSGVPVIRGQNLGIDRWVGGDFVFVTVEKAKSLSPNLAKPGDLIFTQRGTLGQVAIVPDNHYSLYLVSQSQMKLTVDKNKVNALFVYYWFTTKEIQDYIYRNAIQTGVPHTNLGILRDTPIILPALPIQEEIASILGSIDDKIELNQRMNQTLEEMARAIFKSWFVDFDPVRAKAEGRDPGLPAEIADLFPDSFEESPLGEIPKGWRISTIGEEVSVVGGSTPSTKEEAYWDNGTYAWTTPKDLAGLSSPILIKSERRITAEGLKQISSGLLPKGSVLLSSRAPIGYLAIANIPTAINQGFIGMVCEKDLPNDYVLFWARQNMEEIKARANGTTFQEISKANFRPIAIIVPDSLVLEAFTLFVGSMIKRVTGNLLENETVKEIRDALLPKLINGEISLNG